MMSSNMYYVSRGTVRSLGFRLEGCVRVGLCHGLHTVRAGVRERGIEAGDVVNLYPSPSPAPPLSAREGRLGHVIL